MITEGESERKKIVPEAGSARAAQGGRAVAVGVKEHDGDAEKSISRFVSSTPPTPAAKRNNLRKRNGETKRFRETKPQPLIQQ